MHEITKISKLKRVKLFVVNFIHNATGDATPISTKPVEYDEATRIKAEAEKSGKYDLKSGHFAALRLTDDEQDRYEEKLKRAASSTQPQPTESAKPAKGKANAQTEVE